MFDLQSRGRQFNIRLKLLSGSNYGQTVHYTHALCISFTLAKGW